MGGDESSDEESVKREEQHIKEEDQVVEFSAEDAKEWEAKLFTKMQEAGVDQVELDYLTVIDRNGRHINIQKGIDSASFPIRVKYEVPSEAPSESKPKKAPPCKDEPDKKTVNTES